jgi:hypothetical protein
MIMPHDRTAAGVNQQSHKPAGSPTARGGAA